MVPSSLECELSEVLFSDHAILFAGHTQFHAVAALELKGDVVTSGAGMTAAMMGDALGNRHSGDGQDGGGVVFPPLYEDSYKYIDKNHDGDREEYTNQRHCTKD